MSNGSTFHTPRDILVIIRNGRWRLSDTDIYKISYSACVAAGTDAKAEAKSIL